MNTICFVPALSGDLERLRGLYWKLLDSSEVYARILKWKKNIYPCDNDWSQYIQKGEMYFVQQQGQTVGALALTNSQNENYHRIAWAVEAKDDEVAVIHLLAIDPELQGRGLARAVLEEAVRTAKASGKKALRLDAIATNTPAQALYERFGFVNRGTAEDYYESTGTVDFVFYEYPL